MESGWAFFSIASQNLGLTVKPSGASADETWMQALREGLGKTLRTRIYIDSYQDLGNGCTLGRKLWSIYIHLGVYSGIGARYRLPILYNQFFSTDTANRTDFQHHSESFAICSTFDSVHPLRNAFTIQTTITWSLLHNNTQSFGKRVLLFHRFPSPSTNNHPTFTTPASNHVYLSGPWSS